MSSDSSSKAEDVNTVKGFIKKLKSDIGSSFHEKYDNYQGINKDQQETISQFVSEACDDVQNSAIRSGYQEDPWQSALREEFTNMVSTVANLPTTRWTDEVTPDLCFQVSSDRLWDKYQEAIEKELRGETAVDISNDSNSAVDYQMPSQPESLGETADTGSNGSSCSLVGNSEGNQTDDSVSDFDLGGK